MAVPASRHAISSLIPKSRLVELNGLRFGYGAQRELRLHGADDASYVELPLLPPND